jgi:hypothetical protein
MQSFVPIKIEELIDAFDMCIDNSTRYLDTESGIIATHRNTKGDTDSNGNIIEGKNPFYHKKFVEIPPGFYETYRDMEEFLQTVADKYLKASLGASLAKPDSFKAFRRALKEYPKENGRWYKFRRQMIGQRVHEWLEKHNLTINK